MKLLIAYLLLINAAACLIMRGDKVRAQKNRRRISERTLFILAFLFGSLGIFIGMRAFHHKTRKKKFSLGIPCLLLLQGTLIIFLHTAL